MKTFAFKNSQKYWSTRYSFVPRNYSTLNRDMFTSHPSGSDAIYIHGPKANSPKNMYYGQITRSKIKFTFNSDPSQNKVYKNISLEGSFLKKDILGTFLANDSTDLSQARASSINGWKEKGAHIHANVARSPNSGRANIVPVGVIRRAHQAFFPELTGEMGDMWTDTGKSQAEWLAPDSIANIMATDGTGPNGLAAILPYGLDRAYLLNNSLMSADPTALTRSESRYLFMEIDFFPGYRDSSGKAKYMLAGVDDFDPSTLYGVPYDSVEAPYLSDRSLCAFAKNKATGNFKKRKYTSSEDGGVGFTFDQSITASVDNTPTKEGLFVFLQDVNIPDDGGDPPTETVFDCASTTIVIEPGTIGDPVVAYATVGSIESVVPSEYVKGTATYTVNLTVPGGYTNVGDSFACTVQGTGSEEVVDSEDLGVFTCTIANFTVFGGSNAIEGEPINYSLNFGTLAGDPPVYIAGTNTYEVSINIPKGYDNYEDGTIVCSAEQTAFPQSVGSGPGDLNNDGAVGSADLLLLLANFGLQGGTEQGDLDGDGSIGVSDLLSMLTAFGAVYDTETQDKLRSSPMGIPGYVSALNAIIDAASPLIVYAITPEHVNGEAARGNYADVSLTFPGGGFELDIVNLDYEPTQLDHSR